MPLTVEFKIISVYYWQTEIKKRWFKHQPEQKLSQTLLGCLTFCLAGLYDTACFPIEDLPWRFSKETNLGWNMFLRWATCRYIIDEFGFEKVNPWTILVDSWNYSFWLLDKFLLALLIVHSDSLDYAFKFFEPFSWLLEPLTPWIVHFYGMCLIETSLQYAPVGLHTMQHNWGISTMLC